MALCRWFDHAFRFACLRAENARFDSHLFSQSLTSLRREIAEHFPVSLPLPSFVGINDRCPHDDIVARVPQMAARIDPILHQLDVLLDDDALSQLVREDVCHRCPRTRTFGRPSTPGETILRMLLLTHLHDWSFQETVDQGNQNLILRWFCRLGWRDAPDDTTLMRWAHTLQPETLHRLVERTAVLATQAKVTTGRTLRIDGTCVQTEIHHPTDSGLLVDSVRTLGRLVKQAKEVLVAQGAKAEQVCRSRLRTARRAAQILHRQLRRKSDDKETVKKKQDQILVETTEHMVHQATAVVEHLQQAQAVLPLVERVIDQTRRRVFAGEKVPSEEKVLSLVEPHTNAVLRGKSAHQVEFGRQVILDEVDGGIITRDEILEQTTEHGQAVLAVEHHVALFARPPTTVAADRGVHSAGTEKALRALGVRHVAIPASGTVSAERRALEHAPAFRRRYRFRAGIEGRIASLKRDHGWRECRYHGLDGMERWVGLGALASNLNRIAKVSGR